MAGQWVPKFDFAVDEQTFGRTLEADPGLEGSDTYGTEPWTESPATSHTEAFRYFDTRLPQNRWLKRIGAPSELQVRFKATDMAPAKLYSYFFQNAEQGKAIFEEMKASAHPGEVVDAKLIKGAVPYRRRT